MQQISLISQNGSDDLHCHALTALAYTMLLIIAARLNQNKQWSSFDTEKYSVDSLTSIQ
ncbi:hypothetical protein BDR04DRAFT_1086304 [Suillus decipiens]|nr:hypothetical protein BDR04DRAFT_1086304 [Suillus decipiens]